MNRTVRRSAVCLFVTITLLFLFSSVQAQTKPAPQSLPKSIVIGTHPKGSLMNIVGSAFAKVINAHLPIEAADRPYTGYVSWLPLLNLGEVDMGVSSCQAAYYAYHGLKPYREAHRNIRVVSSGASLTTGFVVRADSGIKLVKDLRGRKVCLDIASLSTRRAQEANLKAAGLDPKKDVIAVPMAGVTATVRALMEGRADAAWASTGMGVVKELKARVGGIYWLPVVWPPDSPLAKLVIEAAPGSRIERIEAGKLPAVNNDTLLSSKPIYLVSSEQLSDEVVYQIMNTIWTNHRELVSIHPIFKGWKKSTMVIENATVPYHPGAIRIYREVGAWSGGMDEVQERLLGQ